MDIELEILQYSYWEHFKAGKDLAFIFPPEHPKRIQLEKTINDLLDKIHAKTNIDYGNTGRTPS